jgi:zinc transporter ZupT
VTGLGSVSGASWHPPAVLLLALAAGAANVLGGYATVWRQVGPRTLLSFLAAGGGFLLAAALLDMLPEVLQGGAALGPALVVAGYLLLLYFENFLTRHSHRYERHGEHARVGHREPVSRAGALAVVASMAIHTFFDGVSIAAGFAAGGGALGILMFEAVILHNVGDGWSVSSVVLAASGNRFHALLASVAIGASTVAGAGAALLAGGLGGQAERAALGMAAGTFLYIALTDLIPAVNDSGDRRGVLWVTAGLLAFVASARLLAAM